MPTFKLVLVGDGGVGGGGGGGGGVESDFSVLIRAKAVGFVLGPS